jgi:hypothetical protein
MPLGPSREVGGKKGATSADARGNSIEYLKPRSVKLHNLGVDVDPAPPPITQFARRGPPEAQADFDDDHDQDDLTAGA